MAETEGQEQPRRSFDWNLLHTFMVIVQEGSITRAAERLLYRQPTVSNALRRLEEQLGKRLADRGPGRFELTEHGSVLYRECQEICGSIGRLRQLLDDDGRRAHRPPHHPHGQPCGLPAPGRDPRRVPCPPPQGEPGYRYRHVEPRDRLSTGQASHPRRLPGPREAPAAGLPVALPGTLRLLLRAAPSPVPPPGLSLEDLGGENFVSFRTDQLTDALRPVAMLRAQLPEQGPTVGTSSNLEEVRRMIVAGSRHRPAAHPRGGARGPRRASLAPASLRGSAGGGHLRGHQPPRHPGPRRAAVPGRTHRPLGGGAARAAGVAWEPADRTVSSECLSWDG
ncbi:MAG: LysR family transcriptional regulator [Arhodomonas sp.]|nr:LysR family transcriptional regulator [Arhodomonas sp.]